MCAPDDQCANSLTCAVSVTEPAHLTKAVLQDFVVRLQERGLAPVSCNAYFKGINSFVGWLHAEGHLQDRLVLRVGVPRI